MHPSESCDFLSAKPQAALHETSKFLEPLKKFETSCLLQSDASTLLATSNRLSCKSCRILVDPRGSLTPKPNRQEISYPSEASDKTSMKASGGDGAMLCGALFGCAELGTSVLQQRGYLEGQGNLVSLLITLISHTITQMSRIVYLLTRSP